MLQTMACPAAGLRACKQPAYVLSAMAIPDVGPASATALTYTGGWRSVPRNAKWRLRTSPPELRVASPANTVAEHVLHECTYKPAHEQIGHFRGYHAEHVRSQYTEANCMQGCCHVQACSFTLQCSVRLVRSFPFHCAYDSGTRSCTHAAAFGLEI